MTTGKFIMELLSGFCVLNSFNGQVICVEHYYFTQVSYM